MKTRSEVKAEQRAKATAETNAETPRAKAEVVDNEPAGDAAPTPKKNPFNWPNANAAKETDVRADLKQVVETIFVDDIMAEWKSLERALELGDKRTEHAHVLIALDKAARRADRAFRLYLTAKMAREKWEAENEPVWGAMWDQAVRALQAEKDAGTRSKQVTDADVKARVAVLFPDEYRAQEEKRRAVEFTVKSLERLADIWLKKVSNLETHANKVRG